MGCKTPGSTAPGYWGRNPYKRIQSEQIPDKIKVLEQDKLIAMGRPVNLWQPVEADTPGVVPCTCAKETATRSDHKCFSCYGVQLVPGYLRFQHDTIHFSSAEHASYTFTNTERDLRIKPNRLRLTSSALSGTVETQDKAFENSTSEDWEWRIEAFNKTNTDLITVEFSTNAGAVWHDVSQLNGPYKPVGTGTIRFRISLARASITTDSPDFEILRIRRPRPEDQNSAVTDKRPELLPGQILLLRTWEAEQVNRHQHVGRQVELGGDKAWTAPLDFFDVNITKDTPAAKITDRTGGPHPFYEHAFGIHTGQRLPIYQISFNEQLLTFTHQTFSDRRAQDGEVYGLVF